VGKPNIKTERNYVMAFFKTLDSLAIAADATGDYDGIIKLAEESEFTVNDFKVHHNLVYGNVFTGENLVKTAEDLEESRLVTAVELYEKLASEEIGEDEAVEALEAVGLTVEDYNMVSDLLDKQAEEAGLVEPAAEAGGITADDAVWEKVAEAYEYLTDGGLDAVASMEFAEAYTEAEDEEAQDKVASEYDGLDEESLDKIAEAFEYLEDIEGVPVSALMEEYDKEAGKMGNIVEKVWKSKAMKSAKSAKDAATKRMSDNREGLRKGRKRWLAEDERVNAIAGYRQAKGLRAAARKEIKGIKRHRAKVAGGAAAGTAVIGGGAAYASSNKK